MAHPMCYLLLNDTVDFQLPSISTLVPQGPCSVFHSNMRQFTDL